MKKIGIYAETENKSGYGHIMRCLSIAQVLKQNGVQVSIFNSNPFVSQMIQGKGIQEIEIVSLGVDRSRFETMLVTYVEKLELDGVLIDSYFADDTLYGLIQKYAKVMVFDGKELFPQNVDMVINHSLLAKKEVYVQKYESTVGLAVGNAYIPIRKEFVHGSWQVNDEVKDILLTVGATDEANCCDALLAAFSSRPEMDGCTVHVIVGPFFKYASALVDQYKDHRNVCFYRNVEHMDVLMKRCDLAVTAAGTTIFELMSLGIPTIVFATAENQMVNSPIGQIAVWCGDIRKSEGVTSQKAVQAITEQTVQLLESKSRRIEISEKEKRFIDGSGAERIADMMIRVISA